MLICKVQTFTSHSTTNRPSACWRSCSDEVNRTTSSAKSREAIRKAPNQTLSSPQLWLEILSIKSQTKLVTRDNPGGAQHPLKKCLTSCQEYRQSSHFGYLDWMAYSNGHGTPYSCSTPHRGNTVINLLQVHYTHIDWMGKLPNPPITLQGKSWSSVPRTRQTPHCFLWIWGLTIAQNILSSTLAWAFPREAEHCDWCTPSDRLLLKMGTTTLVCHHPHLAPCCWGASL